MKYQIKAIVILICFILLADVGYGEDSKQAKVSVICYHTFLGKSKIATDVSIEDLFKQMKLLKNQGFRFVTINELAQGKVKGNKNIFITIDDGNRSILEANKKVFRPMGIKPMLGIYPNIIGKKDYALNWDELKSLSDEGFSIASHGYYHLLLNEKQFIKDEKAFKDEIFKSKKVLEEKLGKKIEVFFYPNGVRSESAKKMLRQAGYKYAFTIVWGEIFVPLDAKNDPLELPRYMISGNFDQISSILLRNSSR
jgi:peptidoglycan/xylan/chitin deacetylase (PgdA/CDA1 family)